MTEGHMPKYTPKVFDTCYNASTGPFLGCLREDRHA